MDGTVEKLTNDVTVIPERTVLYLDALTLSSAIRVKGRHSNPYNP